jgi:hypothetical protein
MQKKISLKLLPFEVADSSILKKAIAKALSKKES